MTGFKGHSWYETIHAREAIHMVDKTRQQWVPTKMQNLSRGRREGK
jgi:hypothetical protein